MKSLRSLSDHLVTASRPLLSYKTSPRDRKVGLDERKMTRPMKQVRVQDKDDLSADAQATAAATLTLAYLRIPREHPVKE